MKLSQSIWESNVDDIQFTPLELSHIYVVTINAFERIYRIERHANAKKNNICELYLSLKWIGSCYLIYYMDIISINDEPHIYVPTTTSYQHPSYVYKSKLDRNLICLTENVEIVIYFRVLTIYLVPLDHAFKDT